MMGFLKRLLGRSEENLGAKTGASAPGAVASAVSSPLRVGDRVRDAFGATGSITAIDPNAEHGLGMVKVQFDDGREAALALVASGLAWSAWSDRFDRAPTLP